MYNTGQWFYMVIINSSIIIIIIGIRISNVQVCNSLLRGCFLHQMICDPTLVTFDPLIFFLVERTQEVNWAGYYVINNRQ